ncbi:ABC transporter ATP-binding protein [Nocardiopsis sp. ATB16-24]|uniref:ABC transporter ATP-binding protein n=1 Tax=Nocardiopsis sp. ATB16-24 TaxID=3019555 RepID=UPI002555C9D4|nr:ABC transporter ATP-binding protein [Nocardiopsis sp. ATB16-24]
MTDRPADRLLVRTVRTHLGRNILLTALCLVGAGAALLVPAAVAAAVDDRLGEQGSGAVWWLGGVVVFVALANVGTQMMTALCVADATVELRRRFLDRLLRLGTVERERFTTGDLTMRITSATGVAASVVTLPGRFLASVTVSGGALVALWWVDPRIACTFLAGVPAAFLLMKAFVGRATPVLDRQLAVQGKISGLLLEVLAGRRSVRSAGSEHREAARVLSLLPELRSVGRAMWDMQAKVSWQAGLLAPAMQVLVLATAGYALTTGGISPGSLLAASGYTLLALGLFEQVAVFMGLAQARAGAHRLTEIEDTPVMRYGNRDLPPGPGSVRFRGVGVHGPNGSLLSRVDLCVPGGTVVAVVGRSGAGKTLLAALAGRLRDPDEGVVEIDGVPVHELSAEALGEAVGWAFERPAHLGSSLADTIRFGNGELDLPTVVEAARRARADAFVRRLPQGYDTPPSEAPMSGGELQRLGLARAMAHRGRLLILDEAMSSLDSVTEHEISEVLDTALSDRTQIVLAHRMSRAARADLVLWLDGGRVRGFAPHSELLGRPGYRELFGSEEQNARHAPRATEAPDTEGYSHAVQAE